MCSDAGDVFGKCLQCAQEERSPKEANAKLSDHKDLAPAAPACEEDADRELETMQGQEDAAGGPCQDNVLVQQVTDNIAKMLDAKLENVIKPVTEMSTRLWRDWRRWSSGSPTWRT